jgi:hypothetical protein
VYCACTWPVQRAEKWSTETLAAGELLPQLKFTVGSVCVSTWLVSVWSAKYWPVSPVPVPTTGPACGLADTPADLPLWPAPLTAVTW